MILRRILLFLASGAALATAAGVVVVALAYALYALVKPAIGPAGAAAVVAGGAALLIGLIGLMLAMAAAPPRRRKGRQPDSLVDRITDFVREKPVTAIVSAVAAGLMAVRNPKYLGDVLRTFLDGGEGPRRR